MDSGTMGNRTQGEAGWTGAIGLGNAPEACMAATDHACTTPPVQYVFLELTVGSSLVCLPRSIHGSRRVNACSSLVAFLDRAANSVCAFQNSKA